jgi:hypothetical protein
MKTALYFPEFFACTIRFAGSIESMTCWPRCTGDSDEWLSFYCNSFCPDRLLGLFLAWGMATGSSAPLLLLVVYLFYISGRKTGSNMPSIGDLLAMGGLFLAWIYLVLLYIAKAFAWLGLKDSNQ